MGLYRAGFDVTGVDIEPQPHYPNVRDDGTEFYQADALEVLRGEHPRVEPRLFDFIWASPPCQDYTSASAKSKAAGKEYPDLVDPVRDLLRATGLPWVIENVVGAPLRAPALLCGAMFGLQVIRHRLFETNWLLMAPPHPDHRGTTLRGEYVMVAGHGGITSWHLRERERLGLPSRMPLETVAGHRVAMGIDWMTGAELAQAIPPRLLGVHRQAGYPLPAGACRMTADKWPIRTIVSTCGRAIGRACDTELTLPAYKLECGHSVASRVPLEIGVERGCRACAVVGVTVQSGQVADPVGGGG